MKFIVVTASLLFGLVLLGLTVSWKINNSKSIAAKASVVKKVTLEDEQKQDAKIVWWAPMNGGAYADKENKLYLIGFREDGVLVWKKGTE